MSRDKQVDSIICQSIYYSQAYKSRPNRSGREPRKGGRAIPKRVTLAASVQLSDIGVRSGLHITVTLHPAPADAGLVLRRTDVDAQWPIGVDTAHPSPDCTAIGNSQAHVIFAEHLLAVLAAAGITDAVIEVSGPEVPLFDGSAKQWWGAVQNVGTKPLTGEVVPLTLREPVVIEDDASFIAALPAQRAEYYYMVVSDHPLIGHQWASYCPDRDDFGTQIAPARTFIKYEKALVAQQAGQLKGGSERNAIVIYPDRLSAPPELPQAFARHKILDLLGDLYVLGRPVQARIIAAGSGHTQNLLLAKRLADELR